VRGWRARLLDTLVTSHLRAIDAEQVRPERTSEARVLATVYLCGFLLWVLNYVVLDLGVQRRVAAFLIEHLGLWGGDLEQVLATEMALTMRIAWALGCMTLYLVVPALVYRFGFRRRVLELLSPKGFVKHLWIYVLLFLPVAGCVWVVSFQGSFQATYPFYRNPPSAWHLLLWELFYGLQFFSLEFFFRGFMLAEVKLRFGWRAVLIMVVPYCMIHFGKPALEALGALVAGTVLGVLALRTRNIWGGVAIHVAVAWWMDVSSLIRQGWFER
jgi:membrane protease YdiL (CAAX protease family)